MADSTMGSDVRPTPDDDLPALATGELVGRYHVVAHIGSGAMGTVYAAHDPELDRKVALKLVRTRRVAGSLGRSRLQREALALARLSHPNVVAIHDVGVRGDEVWLAMEYVEGRTVARWLAESTRTWPEVLDVMIRVGRGLEAAHASGLVHRDVKPDNVMIGGDSHSSYRVVVTDFGLARAMERRESGVAQASEPSPLDSEMTHAGALLGTPAYMSPEQLAGHIADAKSDQFGFAVMLWEALFGRRPFGGANACELAAAVLGGSIRAPRRGHGVPTGLRRIVERGLARDPSQRHPSIGAMVSALEREAARCRRRPRWIALATAIVTVLAVLGMRRIDAHAAGKVHTRSHRASSIFANTVPSIDRSSSAWERARRNDLDAALDAVATIEMERGDFEEAERLWQESLRLREALFGPDHPEVATVLDKLALAREADGAITSAAELRERARAIRIASIAGDSPAAPLGPHHANR